MALTYTAVVGRGRTASDIDNYLYGSSKRVVTVQTEEGVFAVLVTEADTVERVDFLADYQAGRLQSGSFFTHGPDEYLYRVVDNDDLIYSAKRIGINVTALGSLFKTEVGK